MHDAPLVGRAEGVAELHADVDDALHVHRPLALDGRAQRRAVEELHHEVGRAVGERAEVAHVADVRAPDRARALRLAAEARHHPLVAGDLLLEDLHREALVEDDVPRLVDEAHAPLAEDALDRVAALEGRTDERIRGLVGGRRDDAELGSVVGHGGSSRREALRRTDRPVPRYLGQLTVTHIARAPSASNSGDHHPSRSTAAGGAGVSVW